MDKKMDMANKYGLIVQSMRGSGRMIKLTGMVGWNMQMVIYMKVIGKMIERMVKETTSILMGQHIKADGRMINSMVRVSKHGQMELNMKDFIIKVRSTEKVL